MVARLSGCVCVCERIQHTLVARQQMPWCDSLGFGPPTLPVWLQVTGGESSASSINDVGSRFHVLKKDKTMEICSKGPRKSSDVIQHSLIGPATNHATLGRLVVNEKEQQLARDTARPSQETNGRPEGFNSMNVLRAFPSVQDIVWDSGTTKFSVGTVYVCQTHSDLPTPFTI